MTTETKAPETQQAPSEEQPEVFSYSRISSFRKCRLSYRLKYVDKVKTNLQGIESYTGNIVHKAIEDMTRTETIPLPDLQKKTLALFNTTWIKNNSELVIVKKDKDVQFYRDLAAQCIKNFYLTFYPFDQHKTIGVEEHVLFKLGDHHMFQGYIDWLTIDQAETVYIQDWKTGKTLPSKAELRVSEQLSLYEMAIRLKYPEVKKVKHQLHYLQHNRTFESERTPEQLESVKGSFLDSIRDIEEARESDHFPAQVSMLCAWCDFHRDCDAYQEHLLNESVK